jgi:NAD(P)-dependent dehydrogenase (short-subunit alcohol dehydrogenase family)
VGSLARGGEEVSAQGAAPGRLAGKVAVIVGGATGFGLACTRRFSAEGARVVVAGRRLELAQRVAADADGWATTCDVTDDDSIQALVAEVLEREGTIDVAISFAGYQESISLRDLTPEKMAPMIEVQFSGAMYFMRHLANAMAAHGGGSLINISSTTAHRPVVGHIAYAASKAGIEYATQVAALEYGPDQVRVNCIAPHLIETEMTAAIFQHKLPIEAIKMQTPLGRMGTPEDIANCALFLASDEANYISGQIIVVDGANSTQKLPTARDYEMLAKVRPELLE